MIRVGIIEDELPAQEQLVSLLKKTDNVVEIMFKTTTIFESVKLLKLKPKLDLIFMDIQLNDGLSLDIFEKVEVDVPVIFTTAYDQYALQAFQSTGIDYLLKPLKINDLKKALNKYETMGDHFHVQEQSKFQLLNNRIRKTEIKFLVKQGIRFVSVPLTEVAYFYSEHKITFLVNLQGEKYMLDKSLAILEDELSEEDFFRLNRQFLVSSKSIGSFISDKNGKLSVELLPSFVDKIKVSQEKAADFKKWLGGS